MIRLHTQIIESLQSARLPNSTETHPITQPTQTTITHTQPDLPIHQISQTIQNQPDHPDHPVHSISQTIQNQRNHPVTPSQTNQSIKSARPPNLPDHPSRSPRPSGTADAPSQQPQLWRPRPWRPPLLPTTRHCRANRQRREPRVAACVRGNGTSVFARVRGDVFECTWWWREICLFRG